MITRERLHELIKLGATIYCIMNNSKYIADFDLSTGDFTVASDCPIIVEQEVTGHVCGYGFEQLFETKDRAEWALKTVAKRTDRFEPPMWEDFNYYEFQFINHENGGARKIIFEVLKKQDDKAKTGGYISILNTTLLKDIYEVYTPTKKNYIKACKIVRDLFNKGGAK